MVNQRRVFEGVVPLSKLTRLAGLLTDTEGEVRYTLAFDTDSLRVPHAAISMSAELPLECQRTLQRFLLPVHVEQRVALIRDEAEEDALPPGYEAQLVEHDALDPLALLEDELILAVPAVPVKPGTEAMSADWLPEDDVVEAMNPFAALKALKKDT